MSPHDLMLLIYAGSFRHALYIDIKICTNSTLHEEWLSQLYIQWNHLRINLGPLFCPLLRGCPLLEVKSD